jgi:hypothetical protein
MQEENQQQYGQRKPAGGEPGGCSYQGEQPQMTEGLDQSLPVAALIQRSQRFTIDRRSIPGDPTILMCNRHGAYRLLSLKSAADGQINWVYSKVNGG